MFTAEGYRVGVRPPLPGDVAAYAAAVRRSFEHVAEWNPADPDELPSLISRQGDALRTFLVVDLADGGIAGKVNVANIVRGRFLNASLGYDAYLPYAGTGRMSEGLALVVDRCFGGGGFGLGLHRVEVNVQPGNARSVALARRLGFRHEGTTPRMLFLDGAWRDHERFAMTAEEWTGVPKI